MKLYYRAPSPFSRKVRVLAHELNLNERLELAHLDEGFTPMNPGQDLLTVNPVGKIPVLALEDGRCLYDSRVICEYLDTLHDGQRLFPEAEIARWQALTRQALADGIMDAAVNIRYEIVLRPEKLRWAEWRQGQMQKIYRSLDELEQDTDLLDGVVDIGVIAVGCALGYLDFRFPKKAWRESRPALTVWYKQFASRSSMQATPPG